MTSSIKVAILGDLTALYSVRTQCRKSINYQTLDLVLKEEVGLAPDERPDYDAWFTLYSEQNEGQRKFVDNIKDLKWEVETVPPNQVRRGRPTDYRFDTRLAYELGVLSTDDYDKIIIVTDSYELHEPIMNLIEESEPGHVPEVYLAFFSENIDNRWHKILHNPKSPIKFIDLDDKLYRNPPKASAE